MMRVAQQETVESSCYMFSGAEKYGLSCDGCRFKTYCDSLENDRLTIFNNVHMNRINCKEVSICQEEIGLEGMAHW